MLFTDNKTGAIRKLEKTNTSVTLYQKDGDEWEILSIQDSPNDMVAQSFYNYLLHWHMASGFKRTL